MDGIKVEAASEPPYAVPRELEPALPTSASSHRGHRPPQQPEFARALLGFSVEETLDVSVHEMRGTSSRIRKPKDISPRIDRITSYDATKSSSRVVSVGQRTSDEIRHSVSAAKIGSCP